MESRTTTTEPIRFLMTEYDRRRQANPSYSLRAYAKQLRVNPGALSQIMAGKRPLSRKLATKVFDQMLIAPSEKARLIGALGNPSKTSSPKQISDDVFAVISDWYHFAIINLFDTVDFEFDVDWMAERLNLPTPVIRLALQRLENVGLIEQGPDGYRLAQSNVVTTDGIPSAAVRNAQRQMLDKSLNALENVDIESRDITSAQYAINVAQIPKARQLIREFQDKLEALLKIGPTTEVYTLNIQLVPLTVVPQKESHPCV